MCGTRRSVLAKDQPCRRRHRAIGNIMEKLLLRVEEVAESTGLSRATINREIRSGRLLSVKIGRCRRIPHQALENFVRDLTRQHKEAAAGGTK